MTGKFFVCVVLCFFALSTKPAVAQIPSNPDSALQSILGALSGTPLSLQQAGEYAFDNATSARKAESAYLAAAGSLRKESGKFDPELFFNLNYVDQEQPSGSLFSASTTQTISRSGIRMGLPFGTKLELSLNTVRLITNSQFAAFSPEYDASGTLSIRQPLLGGFMSSGRKQLTKSEEEYDAAKARYDQQILAVSTDVERAYWDLYAAERDYAVQKLTRDRAEVFLKETQLRAQTGLIGPNQVASAKTFLAEQELFLLDREEQFDRLSDQLASLIGVRPSGEMTRFLPTDNPRSDIVSDSINVLVEQALKNNLDLQAAHHDIESQQSLASAAGWEALPSIDLTGSLGGTGLAGTSRNISFGGFSSPAAPGATLGDALQQVTKRQFPNWSLGVEVTIPIGFRSGFGEKDRLDAQVLGAQQRYIEQSRTLEEQVRSTYRELSNGKNRLKAAREGVDAAQEQIRIGMIEFYNGRSTAFELVRLGEDYAVSQRRYSEALVRTAKAAATLKQLTSGAYPSASNN